MVSSPCYNFSMTTFLLHGGKTSTQNPENEYFFKQFAELVPKTAVTVLFCYFARPKSDWDKLLARDTATIVRNTTKSIETLVAQDPADLLKKIELVDVLYVAGGDADPIEVLYKDLTGLAQKLDGKVYAGSSMGAFMASTQYVLSYEDQRVDEIHAGLGLLSIQTLCHWDLEEQKDQKLQLLSDSSSQSILVLKEFETVVLYA